MVCVIVYLQKAVWIVGYIEGVIDGFCFGFYFWLCETHWGADMLESLGPACKQEKNQVHLCFVLKVYADLFFILLHSFSLLLANDNMTSVSGLVYGWISWKPNEAYF